jgi:hypothetical protein
MSPSTEEERGLQLLAASADAIVVGVARELPGWVERQVERILDAWGRCDASTRARAERGAVDAGRAAAERVEDELHHLFTLDPAEQRATPLEIVRSAFREPTAVLVAAGIPPVARDEFDERAWPDDCYGLAIHDLGDLGDEELAPLHFAWGMAKAGVLRARADRAGSDP